MKTINKLFLLSFLSLFVSACDRDFLEVPPQDQLTDESFWLSEANIRTFAFGFYQRHFIGYGSGFTWGNYFSGQSLNDDFAPSNPARFTQQVPTTSPNPSREDLRGWTFARVRKANIMIDRVENAPITEEAINHWSGIGHFFRALEYYDLVRRYGDVPYYDRELSEEDTEELYKPRDDRAFVMDRILEDFQFAAENVRESVDNDGQEVNRSVVLAFMSRVLLFEGTWQKYHKNNNTKAAEYLEAAKWAADQVIGSGKFSLGNYREVFNSLSLANNPEVILYREYQPGILTHALNSYNNKEPQTGVSMNAVESYLMNDGLPIAISPLYQGDMTVEEVMADRDPRIYETLVWYELRVNGVAANHSTSGYATHKFLNESIADDPIGSSNLNPTDAPIIRYGEVLMNYAEASAELASVGGPALTQEDLDKSVNVLRGRPGINLPHLQLAGGEPAVNGMNYSDPERDSDVPSMIWEIRRERRIELMMEGFRLDDLRRWKKLEYTDMVQNPAINRGAWIRKSDYPESNLESLVLTEGDEGYIVPVSVPESLRMFTDPRVYLEPIPLDQITLYNDQGMELEQNPGW